MPEDTGVTVVWRKSTRSASGGNECVEVAFGPAAVLIRDSKDPTGGHLRVDPIAWTDFVRGVKEGRFDRPALDLPG